MAPTSSNPRISTVPERRRKPRVYTPFIARVSGIDIKGEPFEVEAALDNLSAGGLYIRLDRHVKEDTKMGFLIHFAESSDAVAPVVETQGIVLRSEPTRGGKFGVAVRFTRHRFRDLDLSRREAGSRR